MISHVELLVHVCILPKLNPCCEDFACLVLQHYRAVLLIPDIYERTHIRELMSLLLNNLGFGAAFAHQVGHNLVRLCCTGAVVYKFYNNSAVKS